VLNGSNASGGTAGNVSGPLVAGIGLNKSGLFWLTEYQVEPLPGPISAADTFVGNPIREVPLRGTVKDAFLGGYGRYLLLRMEAPARVDVIDLDSMTTVQEMPLEDVDSLLTATADYLFVYSPDIRRLFRFPLPDLAEPEMAIWDAKEPLTGIYGGCSSPRLVLGESRGEEQRATPIFLDVATMEPADVVVNAPMPLRWAKSSIVRASADGSTYGIQGSPSATSIEVRGAVAEVRRAESFVKLAVPSADGETVFTDRYINQPIRNSRFEPVPLDGIQRRQPAGPALHEAFFVSVYSPSSWQEGDTHRGRVSLQMLPHVRPLATFSDVKLISPSNSYYSRKLPLTLDKRLFCRPVEGQIVCIPYSDDRLIVKRFDLASLLRESTFDYLLVTSDPPKTVDAGQTYQYEIEVLARTRARFDLESGPEGMRVAADGLLTWATPQTPDDRSERVSVAISGASPTKKFHNFTVLVRGRGEPETTRPSEPIAGRTDDQMSSERGEPSGLPEGTDALALPAPFDQVAVGGGGRYLVAQLRSMKKLAVIDLVERKIGGYLDAPAEELYFAAGAEKLVLVAPLLKQIHRYDLATRKWELTAPLTNVKPITAVSMGSASSGPILIGSGDDEGDELRFHLLGTLQARRMTVSGTRYVRFKEGVRVAASADGRTFSCWQTSSSPTGLQLLKVAGPNVEAKYAHVSVAFAAPNADGSIIYTRKGLYDPALDVDRPEGLAQSFVLLPGPEVAQRLQIELGAEMEGSESSETAVSQRPTITLHQADQLEPVAGWETLLPRVGERNLLGRVTSTLADRVIYVAASNAIVTLPASNDRILIWPPMP
jgi:hypothetical protein